MNPIDEENLNYSLVSPESQKEENDIDMNAKAYEGVKRVVHSPPVKNKYKRAGKQDNSDNDVIKPRS